MHLPLADYNTFVDICDTLTSKVGPEDLVIVDTVTKLAETLRDNLLHGANPDDSLAKATEAMKGETYGRNSYAEAQRVVMRRLRNLRNRGARIITVLHEDEQIDPYESTMKKRAPMINKAFYSSLIGASSDIFRLSFISSPMVDAGGKEKFPAYTRFLQLRDDENALAKFHVTPDISSKLPKLLSNPTLSKLYKVLNKKPSWLICYGAPGVGKTSFCCNEAEESEPVTKK